MIYIKYFENASVIGNGVEVELPDVSYLHNKNVLFIPGSEGTATVKVNSTTGEIEAETEPDYSQMYLTFEALETGTFSFSNEISYSIDNGTTWVTLAANTNTPTIAAGSKIMWKGNLTPTNDSIGIFSATGNFNAYGNTMSLLYGDNFIGQTDLTDKSYVFYNLFYNNANIINAQNLILPATTLAEGCYSCMFNECSSLETAPELPATTLAENCYNNMFGGGCTSLTTAPELPATTLAESCYNNMFNGCSSLTTAPELPATTLVYNCYGSMFRNCTNLTTAPELPATTLVDYCYEAMFNGCSSLNYIKCLATDISASDCINDWAYGVAATGTFVKAAGVTIPSGVNGIPTGWTVESI